MYFDESLWIKGGEAGILFISPPPRQEAAVRALDHVQGLEQHRRL
jgi:hypothetical protein